MNANEAKAVKVSSQTMMEELTDLNSSYLVSLCSLNSMLKDVLVKLEGDTPLAIDPMTQSSPAPLLAQMDVNNSIFANELSNYEAMVHRLQSLI